MGKFLLLLVAGAAATAGTFLLTPTLSSRSSSGALVADHLGDAVVEQLSASGLNEAAQFLDSLGAVPTAVVVQRGTLMGGTYETTIRPVGTAQVAVHVSATLDGVGRRARASHVQEATFQLLGGGGEPPVAPFLSEALMLEQNLTMNTAQRVRAGDPNVNANIHTNNGAVVNIQDRAGIQGFYYSVEPLPHDWLVDRMRTSFAPNVNPDGAEVFQQRPRVEIPPVVAADHLPFATRVSASNEDGLRGVLDFSDGTVGTRENPALWVVMGDFNTLPSTSLEIHGYVNIVVAGNVNLQGVTRTGAESSVSFYSQGDLSINDTAVLTGSLMANGNVQVGGVGTTLRGPITTRGTINFNEDAHILYTPLSGYMTRPLFDRDAEVEPVRFRPISHRSSRAG